MKPTDSASPDEPRADATADGAQGETHAGASDAGNATDETGPAASGSDGTDGEDPALSGALETMLDVVQGPEENRGFLLVVSGNHTGRLFVLDRGEHLIGRARSADVTIDDKAASQRHAKIVQHETQYTLVDLGSTNGTYVNDELVDGEAPLRIGDVIRIGETLLTFLDEQGAGEASRTIPIRWGYPPPGRSAISRQPLANVAVEAPAVEPQAYGSGEGSIRDLIEKVLVVLDFARRYRGWLIGLTLAGIAAGIALYILFPQPKLATFQVSLKPDAKSNPVERYGRPGDGDLAFFATADRDFKDPKLIRKTLAELGEKDPSNGRVEAIRNNLAFERVSRTDNVFQGSYTASKAEAAKQFLATHMPLFLDYEIDKALKAFQAQVDFLSKQLDEAEADLLDTENHLLEFRKENLDGLPDQAQERFSSKFELSTRQSELSTRLERVNLELQHARNKLKSEDAIVSERVEQTKPYQAALVEVERKISEAKARGLGNDHPELVKLRAEKRDLQRMSEDVLKSKATELERRANAEQQALRDRIKELEVERRVAQKELGQVSSKLSKTEQILEKLPQVEVTNEQLVRSHDAKKALYARLFERLKASQLQLELERSSAQARYDVVQPPTVMATSLLKVAVLRIGAPGVLGFILAICVGLSLELRSYVKENFGPNPIGVRSRGKARAAPSPPR